MNTQFKKGVMDLCVLSLLEKNDCYGYELVEKVSQDIEISEGTLYPILRRLEKEGYLSKYVKDSQKGPSRKYYTLTKRGIQRAKQLRQEWRHFTRQVNEVLR